MSKERFKVLRGEVGRRRREERGREERGHT